MAAKRAAAVPSSAQSIAEARARGLSVPQIARALNRDPSLIRQIAAGKKPGANLAPALHRLATTGRSGVEPPRRTTRAGELAPVRGKRGAPKVTPPAPAAPGPSAKRGAFGVTERQHTAGGGFVQTITAPKSEGVGREQARQAILDALANVPGSAAVTFTWRDSEGFTGTVGAHGGYRVHTARQGMRGEGDDPFAWLVDQAEQTKSPPVGAIVAVTVQVLS